MAAEETPSPVRWAELKVELEENAVFGEHFILPKITIEPRYSGGMIKMGEFAPPERTDLEVKPEDSSARLYAGPLEGEPA